MLLVHLLWRYYLRLWLYYDGVTFTLYLGTHLPNSLQEDHYQFSARFIVCFFVSLGLERGPMRTCYCKWERWGQWPLRFPVFVCRYLCVSDCAATKALAMGSAATHLSFCTLFPRQPTGPPSWLSRCRAETQGLHLLHKVPQSCISNSWTFAECVIRQSPSLKNDWVTGGCFPQPAHLLETRQRLIENAILVFLSQLSGAIWRSDVTLHLSFNSVSMTRWMVRDPTINSKVLALCAEAKWNTKLRQCIRYLIKYPF